MKVINILTLFAILVLSLSIVATAQLTVDDLHGDEIYTASGLHSGNQIRTTFWNDGQVGVRRPARRILAANGR